jgi:hypothetical protein
MGNGVYKYCVPANKSEYDDSDSSLQISKAKSKSKSLSVPHLTIITVQNALRVFLAKKAMMKLIEEHSKNYDQEMEESVGKFIRIDSEINSISIKYQKLKKLEEEFKSSNEKGRQMMEYFNFSTNKKRKIISKGMIRLNNTNDIYTGHWEVNTKSGINEFKRKGYGSLFKEDGMKIEGIWDEDKVVSDGIIYYTNGKIYVGEIGTVSTHHNVLKYVPNGKGSMYYSNSEKTEDNNNTHTTKEIIDGYWTNDVLNGECVVNYPGSFSLACQFIKGKLNFKKGKFSYADKSYYEGEFNKHFQKSGYGIISYNNGEIYQGHWKKDKYHGEGVLFTPSGGFSMSFKLSRENSNNLVDINTTVDILKWGNGRYLKAHWLDGQLHGKGTITTNTNITDCHWRFGKIIQSMVKLGGSNKIFLHDNIFTFLKPSEQTALLPLKNKQIHNYFIKNNMENLLKLRFDQIYLEDVKEYISYQQQHNHHNITNQQINKEITHHFMNKYLIENQNKLLNLEQIIKNYKDNVNEFIPIAAYKTNGGVVQKRFHYSNIFNPNQQNAFCSNYMFNKKNDITVSGVLNPLFYEHHLSHTNNLFQTFGLPVQNLQNNPNNGILLSHNNSNNNSMIRMLIRLENRQHSHHQLNHSEKEKVKNDLIQSATEYIPHYESLLKEYKIDLNQLSFKDDNILNQCTNYNNVLTGNSLKADYFFSVHNLLITCPIKLSLYTILANPVKTFAVYLHMNSDDKLNEPLTENYVNSFNALENHANLEKLIIALKSKNLNIIKINNTEKELTIEFDTHEQYCNNPTSKQLLALIFLKDYKESHLISFKTYYHLGKFVSIHLLDQGSLYGYQKSGIDVGSLMCFGQIYKIKNN